MYIPLEILIEQLGRSAQEAQSHLERQAAEAFFQNFETVNQAAGSWEVPITRRVGLPANGGRGMKTLDVPIAALLRHETLGLDSVKVRLAMRTQVRKEDNALLVEPCAGGQTDGEDAGEVEIMFKAAPPAEGVARLDSNVQKLL